jgi:hypothetical protein
MLDKPHTPQVFLARFYLRHGKMSLLEVGKVVPVLN